MPDRIIRDELLESERWLSLKDNADRLAYVALLLRADSLGNFTAEPFRLLRLWRDFGISSSALVAKTLGELADHDLIRLYSGDDRPLLHIPRFGQRLRYVKRVFPPSPWTTDEQKQTIGGNSPGDSQALTGRSHQKGREVKGSEEKRSEVKSTGGPSISPTRGNATPKVNPRLKNLPPESDPAQVERNRQIGEALQRGDPETAKRLRGDPA